MTAQLTTSYLGLALKNPIVASASPLTGNADSLRRLEDAGAAAAVLPSLFEERIVRDEQRVNALYEFQAHAMAESLTFFPEVRDANLGPHDYLRMIETAKRATNIPIIPSLNGCTPGGWARFARQFQNAGADAVELNIYFVATDPAETAADVESRYTELVAAVRQAVTVPVAVKIGAQFTNLANFVRRLGAAGADGVVLFNRYLEPDVDLSTLRIKPHLAYSTPHEMRLPLRWIAILRDQSSLSFAATSGVHCAEDAVKLLLAGADVCMVASVLLKRGAEYVGQLVEGVQRWLDDNDYESVEQLKGSMSHGNCPDSGQLERANYMKALVSYTASH